MTRHLRDALLRRVLRDGRTKLMALAVAVLAFQMIRSVISEQESFRASVVAVMPQEGGVTVVKVDPSEVRVTLRGSREQLRAVNTDNLVAKVSPRKPTARGSHETILLRDTQIEGKGLTRVAAVEPASVRLEFDIESDVTLALARPVLLGRPLMGRAELIWAETNVVVRGPLNQLRALRDNAVPLTTEPIDVEGRVQSFSRRVKVLPPPDIGVVLVTPAEIDVRVGIKVETEARVYENVPVLLTAVSGGGLILTSDPATVRVRVTGMTERLNQVKLESLSAVVDCRGIAVVRSTITNYPVRVFLPGGLEGLSPEALPATVIVRAQRVVASEPQPEPSVRTEGTLPIRTETPTPAPE